MDANFLMLINTPFDQKKRLFFTDKLIQKIMNISKIESLCIFAFYREQFTHSIFAGTINNFFPLMVNTLVR